MNVINVLQIKVAILSSVLDRFITAINNKYCNRLPTKNLPTQINILNMYDMI
jgi:hypothetical protein